MASEKITAMPDLAGGQVPTDLVTVVDLSAVPASQNVKSTLNDLFATITKNITDRAVRFQAPGTAPAVSAASEGSIYHNGNAFLASSNAGAYEQVYTLAAQTAALVFAGPTTGVPAIPTFRALALTDLPTQTGTGNIVLATNPVMTNPTIDIGITGVSSGRLLGFQPVTSGVNYVDVYNAISTAGPTLHAAGTASNIALNLHAKGTGIVACVGNALRITGSTAGSNGIVQARGGTSSGGVIQLYELTTNGTNWVGLRAPDNLTANLDLQMPSSDGFAGQSLVTDGAGGLAFGGNSAFKNVLINGDMTITQRNTNGSYPALIPGGPISVNTGQNLITTSAITNHGLRVQTVFATNAVMQQVCSDVERVRLFGTTLPGGVNLDTRYVPDIGDTGTILKTSSTFNFTNPATTTGWANGQSVRIWGAGANYWLNLETTVDTFNGSNQLTTLTACGEDATQTLIERTRSLQLRIANTSGAPAGALVTLSSVGSGDVYLYRDTFCKYCLDGFYTFAGSSTGDAVIDVSQVTDGPTGFSKAIELKVPTGWTGQKFFLAQIVEQANCNQLVGKTVTFSFNARVNNSTRISNLKAAIVEWSGTADTFDDSTRRIVATGGFGTSNNGIGSFVSGWTQVGSAATIVPTTSWERYSVTGTISSSSVNNIAVLIWNDTIGATIADDYIRVTGTQLELGATPTQFDYLPASVQLSRAQYYFEVVAVFYLIEQLTMAITMPLFWKQPKRLLTPRLTLFDNAGQAGRVSLYPFTGAEPRSAMANVNGGGDVLFTTLYGGSYVSSAGYRITLTTAPAGYIRQAAFVTDNYGGFACTMWTDASL